MVTALHYNLALKAARKCEELSPQFVRHLQIDVLLVGRWVDHSVWPREESKRDKASKPIHEKRSSGFETAIGIYWLILEG